MGEASYSQVLNEVMETLSKVNEIVIATSHKDKVTAKAYTKYKQIIKNPTVAMAIKNIQTH